MPASQNCSTVVDLLVTVGLFLAAIATASAHPGSSIAVDAQGKIYFVDTGQGVWKLDSLGKLTLIHTLAFHWSSTRKESLQHPSLSAVLITGPSSA